MRARPSRWTCPPYEVGAAMALREELGVSATVAAILTRRGLADPDEARRFLAADERHDPALLPGVPAAVELVRSHVARGSRIAVHGDYDVDGVCSTAILLRALRALGAAPIWELPSRFGEGYGLSEVAVERLAGRGIELLITVDCGVTAVAEVAAARAAGMDVLVVDHHQPGETLPDCTIVHPALGDYPTPELCAAGVALKLSEALRALASSPTGELSPAQDAPPSSPAREASPLSAEHDAPASSPARDASSLSPALDASQASPALDASLRPGDLPAEDLELAALGTVCDLVPLRGENRRIVREGVEALARTRQPGLLALMAVAGLDPGDVDERAIGFRLGPRLNAAGRMRRADAALELLMTTDEARAAEVARELDLLNADRQEAEVRMVSAADAASLEQASQGALVVAGEGWHPGVVGIVASRLVERWGRPVVVISIDGDRARGSGRSISGYDLHAGLAACSTHLRRFGGHRMAAGVELDVAEMDAFRRALAAHAGAALTPDQLIGEERVDAVVPGSALGLELAEELELLRPFGMGNPQPTLLVPAARIEGIAGMGEERKHARFTLVTGASRARGVAFGSPPAALASAREAPHDVAVRLERNRWNGVVEPRVVMRALCPTRSGELEILGVDAPFWERLRAELTRDPATGAALGALPDRGLVVDRRGEGFAGIVGELLTTGETVLVAVADVPRRQAALERLVAGLAGERLSVISWTALAAAPALATRFDNLVALDPPPGGAGDALVRLAPRGHLAWGPAEVEFALAIYRSELELRPALTEAYRTLRQLSADASVEQLEAALRGESRYTRSAEGCARVIRVLTELALVSFDEHAPALTVLDAPRTELDRSPAYCAYRDRLERIARLLDGEGAVAPARAA